MNETSVVLSWGRALGAEGVRGGGGGMPLPLGRTHVPILLLLGVGDPPPRPHTHPCCQPRAEFPLAGGQAEVDGGAVGTRHARGSPANLVRRVVFMAPALRWVAHTRPAGRTRRPVALPVSAQTSGGGAERRGGCPRPHQSRCRWRGSKQSCGKTLPVVGAAVYLLGLESAWLRWTRVSQGDR